MKPNDKAYKAAISAIKENGPYYAGSKIRESMAKHLAEVALPPAYAAQFKSEDYAGLVKQLRNWEAMNYKICGEAADAIEALLAERDALKAENESMKQSLPLWAHKQMAANNELIERLRAERDAFAARLAPVDDDALLKMVDEIIYVRSVMIGTSTDEIAREVITHMRPHIEAAERERCAKIAEEWSASVFGDSFDEKHVTEICNSIAPNIAAAIRSGK